MPGLAVKTWMLFVSRVTYFSDMHTPFSALAGWAAAEIMASSDNGATGGPKIRGWTEPKERKQLW